MDVKLFNPKSRRSHEARFGHVLSSWIPSLEVSTVALLLAGIALVVIGLAAGWALIGLVAMPIMIIEWYKYELRRVPPVSGGSRVDDLLDVEILGMLPAQPSPKDLANALAKTSGGHFFAVRFGIGGGFLEQLASTSRDDTAAVYQEALAIASQTGGRISAGALILALVRQLPEKTRLTLLGHLQLTEDDLIRGIKWYNHLDDLVEKSHGSQRKPGGIGRDWSFGWIPQLSRFGQNISGNHARMTSVRADSVAQLAEMLGKESNSIALVGKVGVGKTEIVYQLAAQLMDSESQVPDSVRYHQVFMLDASRLLSVAGERGRLEQLVETLLGEAFAAKNVVVCLDNAELFFDDAVGSVDLTNVLLPILEANRVPIILTLDEQRWLQIGKRSPALTNAVNRVNIHPTSESHTLEILEDQLPILEFKRKVAYMYQALHEAYKLGARYVYDVSMPGQAVTLLEAAAEYAEDGLVTARSVNQAIEQTTGVRTGKADDDTERETLLNLEQRLHERMVGQDRAVSVVSDALRRARAGVRNQNRPVGTFLFLGPTGVGKTELAKALAAVYFGGEDKIIRLDMNEFVTADDVTRLIADGADDPSSLTAQVMKNPFSVILLDEIEKAHSSVLTALLQLLDEGIMRDERNREVNFRDTIVIATSNANADRIQEYLHRGYSLQQFEEKFVDELLGSHVFHPEFLNRFDEMVVFAPLQKDELLKVVDLILADVNKNLSSQNVTVKVSDEAKLHLVEAGYDPRLGARPMRRVVQKTVENMMAKKMLAKEVDAGDTVEISLDDVASLLTKKQKADKIVEESEK